MDLRPFQTKHLNALSPLVAESQQEGFAFVQRLEKEWREGSNRFDQPGEGYYGGWIDQQLIAIGGISQSPYHDDPRQGRIRRVYILPAFRGKGLGKRLIVHLLERHAPFFDDICLYTDQAKAAAFYEHLGFVRVRG
ncbi:MAG: GNAT family N-acetyltransferase, partial [Bacteroidota bacterium]